MTLHASRGDKGLHKELFADEGVLELVGTTRRLRPICGEGCGS